MELVELRYNHPKQCISLIGWQIGRSHGNCLNPAFSSLAQQPPSMPCLKTQIPLDCATDCWVISLPSRYSSSALLQTLLQRYMQTLRSVPLKVALQPFPPIWPVPHRVLCCNHHLVPDAAFLQPFANPLLRFLVLVVVGTEAGG